MTTNTISIRRPSRAGLSLLELLVALTLGSVLLSAVWAMFSIFTRRLESDTYKAEETQLVRGVHQILSRDLGNLLPQSDATIERGTSIVPGSPRFSPPLSGLALEMATLKSAGPLASFVGTPNRMELQLFDDDPESLAVAEPSSLVEAAENVEPIKQHSSKFVIYSWQGAPKIGIGLNGTNDTSISSVQTIAEPVTLGLRRQEAYPQVEPDNDLVDSGYFARAMSQASRLSKLDASSSLDTSFSPVRTNNVISDETIPEITRIDFGYYDGRSWTSNWNSRDGGNLPIAVRVRFDIDMKYASDNQDIDELDREKPAFNDTVDDSNDSFAPEESWNQEFILIVSQPAPSQPKTNSPLKRTTEHRKPKR